MWNPKHPDSHVSKGFNGRAMACTWTLYRPIGCLGFEIWHLGFTGRGVKAFSRRPTPVGAHGRSCSCQEHGLYIKNLIQCRSCVFVCTEPHMMYIHIYIYLRMHIHIHIHRHRHGQRHIQIHICRSKKVHAELYIYIYIHTICPICSSTLHT